MIRRPHSRLHRAGRRYLLRRVESALVHRDPRGGPDGPRPPWHWLTAGALLTAVMVVGSTVLNTMLDSGRPAPALDEHPVVVDRDSGALYVRAGERWHPVPNLTSAVLISDQGPGVRPRLVDPVALQRAPRGAPLGIPGAPDRIDPPLDPAESVWTLCEGGHTTVFVGRIGNPTPLPAEQPVLVSGPAGTHYLLYDGRRAMVDLDDPAVLQALRLDGVPATAVSAALLNTVPESAPLRVPRIDGLGNPGPAALAGRVVGDVVRAETTTGVQYFVVLAGGVQRIGAVAAELIRFAGHPAGSGIPTVSPSALSAVPRLGVLPLAGYPDRLAAPRRPVTLCVRWDAGAVTLGAEPELPDGGTVVQLAQADGPGPAVDAVWVPPGRSLYVHPERAPQVNILVTRGGVRHLVADPETARLLGLPEHAARAPWPVLAGLPAGPVLSRAAASVARDVMAGPPPPGQGDRDGQRATGGAEQGQGAARPRR